MRAWGSCCPRRGAREFWYWLCAAVQLQMYAAGVAVCAQTPYDEARGEGAPASPPSKDKAARSRAMLARWRGEVVALTTAASAEQLSSAEDASSEERTRACAVMWSLVWDGGSRDTQRKKQQA